MIEICIVLGITIIGLIYLDIAKKNKFNSQKYYNLIFDYCATPYFNHLFFYNICNTQ